MCEGFVEDVGFQWCATSVDENGKYLRWSVCDHDACESYGTLKKYLWLFILNWTNNDTKWHCLPDIAEKRNSTFGK